MELLCAGQIIYKSSLFIKRVDLKYYFCYTFSYLLCNLISVRSYHISILVQSILKTENDQLKIAAQYPQVVVEHVSVGLLDPLSPREKIGTAAMLGRLQSS